MNTSQEYFQLLANERSESAKHLQKPFVRGFWKSVVQKYSGKAHFIYELLQNADDAKATCVSFELNHDGLWFSHNGKIRFSISDPSTEDENAENGNLGHINSITAINFSNKPNGEQEEQKIGKFGVGFKAVFAYSATPHIYDDPFNFRLEDYIVPHAIESTVKRKDGETLFYFPFNRPSKSPDIAYTEIQQELKNLNNILLFLPNLTLIDWKSVSENGYYSKIITPYQEAENLKILSVKITKSFANKKSSDKLWVFQRSVNISSDSYAHNISIGFPLTNANELQTTEKFYAYCFFVTKEITNFGFLVHAPFLLNDSREGIREEESANEEFITALAELSADAIVKLKEISIQEKSILINDNIIEIIGLGDSYYGPLFRPVTDSITLAFKTNQIVPGRNGHYYTKAKAYWPSDKELSDLFSDNQISRLMQNPNSGLVFVTKGHKQFSTSSTTYRFINSIVTELLDPQKLLRRIDAAFIEAQSDTWLTKFYNYLSARPHLFEKDKLHYKKPILLNQDRKAVIPFDDKTKTANIFLSPKGTTSFATIYEPFANKPKLVKFFKSFGIAEPNLKAEIFKSVIPVYKSLPDEVEDSIVISHMEMILEYFKNCTDSEKNELVSQILDVNILCAFTSEDSETSFLSKPENIYLADDSIKEYFKFTNDVAFLDTAYYTAHFNDEQTQLFFKFIKHLGISNNPKLFRRRHSVSYYNCTTFGLDPYGYSRKYESECYIIDKELYGLSDVIEHISLETSVLIWNYLLNYISEHTQGILRSELFGVYVHYPKHKRQIESIEFKSSVCKLLFDKEWLYDKDGTLSGIKALSFETLHNNFNLSHPYSKALLVFLEFPTFTQELGLSDIQKQCFLVVQKYLNEGFTPEKMEELLSSYRSKNILINAPVSFNHDYDKTFSESKDRLKKRLETLPVKSEYEIEQIPNIDLETVIDQDEFSKPSLDLQKKLEKLKEQMDLQIEEVTRTEKLNELVVASDQFSFIWFKTLLELEYLSSSESNQKSAGLTIHFNNVEKESGTERTLILKDPNRYIPLSLEDIGDLQVQFFQGDEIKSATIEVVSVKEYTLRAKLKKSFDWSDINFDEVNRAIISVKNPIFILDELRKAFNQLKFSDEYNLQENLPETLRFIFGPPGTGKTTYLAVNEIIPLMKKNEDIKILVLAPTNKAADVLTKRIITEMGDDISYYDWLLRFGSAADIDLEDNQIVIDQKFDIRKRPNNTTITTVARFVYDYFQPNSYDERFHLKYLHWDYIIVDEASMLSIANISYIIYQKPDSQIIIAGDPFQIQPITQISHWKDMNIYSMIKLDKFILPETVPHPFEIINLTKQYRSIPSIGSIFSNFTYDGILEHHRIAESQKKLNLHELSFKDINLIKFPVSNFEGIYKPNYLNKSSYQIYASLFCIEFVMSLTKFISNSYKSKVTVGVICPYRAQASLIEKLLGQLLPPSQNIEINMGTIHGFQGDECDIMIAVFNPPQYISKSPEMFLNKKNILNVSISRARDYLFLLMPDNNTENIKNLYLLNSIEKKIKQLPSDKYAEFSTKYLEEKMFGDKTFIYNNSFATSHQAVNVYSKPEKKYEIRCEDSALDIQVKND